MEIVITKRAASPPRPTRRGIPALPTTHRAGSPKKPGWPTASDRPPVTPIVAQPAPPYRLRILGSNASRSASPNRFHARTKRTMHPPGKTTVYQNRKGSSGGPTM